MPDNTTSHTMEKAILEHFSKALKKPIESLTTGLEVPFTFDLPGYEMTTFFKNAGATFSVIEDFDGGSVAFSGLLVNVKGVDMHKFFIFKDKNDYSKYEVCESFEELKKKSRYFKDEKILQMQKGKSLEERLCDVLKLSIRRKYGQDLTKRILILIMMESPTC